MSILKSSEGLSHHSLESFILQRSDNISAYDLPELIKHPNIPTISEKVKNIWTILSNETFASASNKNLIEVLNEKQVAQLKMLTILNLLQQKNSISLKLLTSQIKVTNIELFKMLIEMSSKNLVNVKIDEKSGVCHILSSKRRQQLAYSNSNSHLLVECEERLNKILNDNNKLIRNLSRAQVI